MLSADTNIFIHAANSRSPLNEPARNFLHENSTNSDFVLCELVLIELYMALRNKAILTKPLSSKAATNYCHQIKSNPAWQVIDYVPDVADELWKWAAQTRSGFRRIIDARIAFTHLHHGVSEFATINTKDFKEFDFAKVWDPLR